MKQAPIQPNPNLSKVGPDTASLSNSRINMAQPDNQIAHFILPRQPRCALPGQHSRQSSAASLTATGTRRDTGSLAQPLPIMHAGLNYTLWESWRQKLPTRINLLPVLPALRLLLVWDNLQGLLDSSNDRVDVLRRRSTVL